MPELTKLQNFFHNFLPHPHTHQRARLLHWHYLIIYILLFLLLKTGLGLVEVFKPGILGIDAQISATEVLNLSNQERVKKGLPILKENSQLERAAKLKAQNMLAENYWAHFAPSGKDPWSFIKSQGYKFSFAGENLAKSFYSSDEVVQAWMNSPTHRENILNSNYEEMGIAVVEGTLQGQKTTLIVQMFGRPYESPLARADLGSQKLVVSSESLSLGAQSQIKPVIDPFSLTKIFGVAILTFVGALYLLDLLALKLRGVFRFSPHHLAHMSILALGGFSLLIVRPGQIL